MPIFSPSLARVASAFRMGPGIRHEAPRRRSLKTHYRTSRREPFLSFFPSLSRFPCVSYSDTATRRVSTNQADRFETGRSYGPFNYFAISDPRCDPVGADLRTCIEGPVKLVKDYSTEGTPG